MLTPFTFSCQAPCCLQGKNINFHLRQRRYA